MGRGYSLPLITTTMIIAEKGITPHIQLWRGDITATDFTLLLINTTSEEVTRIEGLHDTTPSRHIITLVPPKEAWETLPNGEYEYYIENKGSILALGLLKNIENIENIGYDTEDIYTEYRE